MVVPGSATREIGRGEVTKRKPASAGVWAEREEGKERSAAKTKRRR
jgi:hypothetical protein